MSAKDAVTLTRSGTDTPAAAVMSWNRPPPILPELIAADLVREIDVGQPVAIDVGDGQAVAMVVVGGLVGLAGIGHDAVLEGDAALGPAIGEGEIVERLHALDGFDLGLTQPSQPGGVLQVVGDVAVAAFPAAACWWRGPGAATGAEEQRRRQRHGSEPGRS